MQLAASQISRWHAHKRLGSSDMTATSCHGFGTAGHAYPAGEDLDIYGSYRVWLEDALKGRRSGRAGGWRKAHDKPAVSGDTVPENRRRGLMAAGGGEYGARGVVSR